MKFNIKVSSTSQGLNLTELTKDHALNIANVLMGVNGIKRLTMEWAPSEEQDPKEITPQSEKIDQTTQPEYPTQDCAISDETAPPAPPGTPPAPQNIQDGQDERNLGNEPAIPADITNPNHPDHPDNTTPSAPSEPYVFAERKKISKKALGPYIDIGIKNLAYHQQPNGDDIVICFGTTKVYTSISDINKLSETNDPTETVDLNINKQIAIRRFKRYCMERGLKPSGDS